MKTIIAGSRKCKLNDVLEACRFAQSNTELGQITEVISGCAKGADTFGELIADHNNIPVKSFPADWNNLEVNNCQIKYRNGKPYNVLAGFNRNEEMAIYADQLIAVWNGKSSGTKDMIDRAKKYNLKIFIWDYINKKELIYE